MKFSVLLPTRNRLDLLKLAIESVRRQDYDNWEIIISDNNSEEDIKTYISALSDERIKYFRTESFLPVTENWNKALNICSGDYFVMLGDDDCLMQGYFLKMKSYIEKFNDPDLIYNSALLFAYPKVFPEKPNGYLHTFAKGEIFKSQKNPFFLDRKTAKKLVKSSLNFQIKFDYNMQFSLIKKSLVNDLKKFGPFFQSPYPDYYASNVLLLKSKKILVVPFHMVTIGISKKSFGFFYFNDKEKAGNQFLKNISDPKTLKKLKHVILPGSNMNDSWLMAMESLVKNYGNEFNLKNNYKRYRFLQILEVYANLLVRNIEINILTLQRKKLNINEKIFLDLPLSFLYTILNQLPFRLRKFFSKFILFLRGSHPKRKLKFFKGEFKNILDVFEKYEIRNYF